MSLVHQRRSAKTGNRFCMVWIETIKQSGNTRLLFCVRPINIYLHYCNLHFYNYICEVLTVRQKPL